MNYEKISEKSGNSITSALDLFTVPATSTYASKSSYKLYLPNNAIDSSPITFKITSGGSFLDLARSYLEISGRVYQMKSGESVWTDVAKAALVNGFGACFPENIRVILNGREISNSNSLYSYRAYLTLLTTYGISATHLEALGYYPEKTMNDENDESFEKRVALISNGKKFNFISPIYTDLTEQDRYLISNCSLDLEITPRFRDKFLIHALGDAGDATTRYKIELLSCKLYVKQVDLLDGLGLSFAQSISNSPVNYPIRKIDMRTFYVCAGRREFNTNLYNAFQPRRILVCFVNNTDYTGSNYKSPFNFVNANVRSISISCNGNIYPLAPYELDFENNAYTRSYWDLQAQLGYAGNNVGNSINLESYANGKTLFLFNLTSSLENDASLELLKTGNVFLEVSFSKEVPANGYSLLIWQEIDSILSVDENRVVTSDIST